MTAISDTMIAFAEACAGADTRVPYIALKLLRASAAGSPVPLEPEALARMLPIDRNVLVNLGMLLEDFGRDDDVRRALGRRGRRRAPLLAGRGSP